MRAAAAAHLPAAMQALAVAQTLAVAVLVEMAVATEAAMAIAEVQRSRAKTPVIRKAVSLQASHATRMQPHRVSATANRAETSTTSSRLAMLLPDFPHRGSPQATATISVAATAPVAAAARVATADGATAGLAGRVVPARLAVDSGSRQFIAWAACDSVIR